MTVRRITIIVLSLLLVVAITLTLTQPEMTQGWATGKNGYPERSIAIVVPFSQGGGTDRFARVVKRAIEELKLLPVPLVIENVSGAGATIGSRRVKDADPDGYTLLLLHEAILTAQASGKVDYGPDAFEPIAGTGELGMVFAVKQESPIKNLTDLMKLVEDNPNEIVFAANLHTPSHFAGLKLEQQHNSMKSEDEEPAHFLFTQTGGGADRLAAVQGEHATATVFSTEEYLRFRPVVRAIAYCDTKRHPAMPDVATTHEQKYPLTNNNLFFWWAPKGTPLERVNTIADALEKAMQSDTVLEELKRTHAQPVFMAKSELRDEIDRRTLAMQRITTRKTVELPDIPLMTLGLAGVLAVLALVEASRNGRAAVKEKGATEPNYPIVLVLSALVVAYVLVLPFVDFRLASVVFLVVGGRLLQRQNTDWPILLLVSFTLPLIVHLVLNDLLQVSLP